MCHTNDENFQMIQLILQTENIKDAIVDIAFILQTLSVTTSDIKCNQLISD